MNYQKIYNQIIERAKSENRQKNSGVYYEAHHIIPTCLGGIGHKSEWKTHPNIVLLTAREHFLCHWLLHEIYPTNDSLFYAFKMMCSTGYNKRYTPSSRIIEYSRIEFSNKMKKRFIGIDERKNRSKSQLGLKKPLIAGENNPAKRLEVREKISKSNKGRKLSLESIEKIRKTKTGKSNIELFGKEKALQASIKKSNTLKENYKKNPELLKRKSESMKGKNTGSQQKFTCPYCSKVGGISTMKQRHLPVCLANTTNSRMNTDNV